jgi:hypothetical protein
MPYAASWREELSKKVELGVLGKVSASTGVVNIINSTLGRLPHGGL